ncbi:MAG: hypothetical protein AAGE52_30090 [Myxococcota bacterium]
MSLLDKRAYLLALGNSPVAFEPTSAHVAAALAYADRVFPSLELKPRNLKGKDIKTSVRQGETLFLHVRAFPRKMPDAYVIVVGTLGSEGEARFHDHILIDLGADYSPPRLEAPALDFDRVIEADDIEKVIPLLHPDDDNPFAIVHTGRETFMQTLRTDEGFVLEYQLVNTSSHYETPAPATEEEVVAAMRSFAFGNCEWLEMFDWQHMDLSE